MVRKQRIRYEDHKWDTRFDMGTSSMLHILWTHYAYNEIKYCKETVKVVHKGRRMVNTYKSLCTYKHGKHSECAACS